MLDRLITPDLRWKQWIIVIVVLVLVVFDNQQHNVERGRSADWFDVGRDHDRAHVWLLALCEQARSGGFVLKQCSSRLYLL